MTSIARIALLAGMAAAVAGCGSDDVFDRQRPDEYAVQRQAPLIVPPDFNLAPPSEGAPRPTDGVQQQALEVLFGGPAARSVVEKSAIDRAGAADPGIRSVIGSENTNTVAKGSVTRDIIAAPEGDGASARASTGN